MTKKRLVVVFSGAGLSADSGVATFRDSNGLWENHRVEDVASPEGWEADKELVLKFYQDRFDSVSNNQPNAAHKAFALLEEKFDVVHITQNIDDFLERAGCSNVTHLHGSIMQRKCEHHQNCVVLDGDLNYSCDYLVDHTAAVKLGDLCPKCGGQLRPHVVWFGEVVNEMNYDRMADLVREVKYHDGVFIVCGTSAQVQPAAFLVSFFAQVKNKYIVDTKPTTVADYALIAGRAAETVPKLVSELLGESEAANRELIFIAAYTKLCLEHSMFLGYDSYMTAKNVFHINGDRFCDSTEEGFLENMKIGSRRILENYGIDEEDVVAFKRTASFLNFLNRSQSDDD